MNKILFIVSLILIFEVSFRLWPKAEIEPEHHFYPFTQSETDTTRWYVYHIFEHSKAILFSIALTIVFSRCSFLVWMFGIDLISFLLNYYSTWTYVYGVPIGCDTVKLAIFGVVIVREALTYYHGQHPDSNEHRNFIAYAHGHVPSSLWVSTRTAVVRLAKKTLFRHSDSRKA